MSLQDLFRGVQQQYGGLGAPSSGAAPGGLDPAIEAQIQALSQPEEIPDLPVENKSKLWQRILSSIADAGSAYAGRAPVWTASMLNRDERINQERIGHDVLKAGAKNKAARIGGELRLQQLINKQEREADANARKALRQQTVEDAQVKRTLELEDEASKRKFILDKEGRDQDWDLKIQKANFAHAEAMEREQNKARNGDKEAEKVLAGFSLGSRIVGGFRRGLGADPKTGAPPVPPLVERLKKGESGDQIRREFESEMNEEGIFGKARDLTRDLFNEQLLRAAREVEKQAENPPAEDSPYGPFTGGVNAWDEAIKGALPPPRQ